MLVGTLKPHFTKWCNRNHTSHKCWWIRTHWNLFPDATVSTSDCAKACPWANIQVIIQCQPDSVIISSLSPWSWGPNGQSVPFICTVPNPKIQIWILSLEEKNLLIQISFFCIFTFRPRNSKTFTSCLWWMLRCQGNRVSSGHQSKLCKWSKDSQGGCPRWNQNTHPSWSCSNSLFS